MSRNIFNMQIGELAKATGTSPRSLRHYEKQGLLRPQRHQNGYRDYPQQAILQIQRIRQLLFAGLTTNTIRRMLPCVLEEGPPVVECPVLRRDLANELSRLDRQIEAMNHSRDLLRATLEGKR
jgi:DNA-binding transcriptional MerR regulator